MISYLSPCSNIKAGYLFLQLKYLPVFWYFQYICRDVLVKVKTKKNPIVIYIYWGKEPFVVRTVKFLGIEHRLSGITARTFTPAAITLDTGIVPSS